MPALNKACNFTKSNTPPSTVFSNCTGNMASVHHTELASWPLLPRTDRENCYCFSYKTVIVFPRKSHPFVDQPIKSLKP